MSPPTLEIDEYTTGDAVDPGPWATQQYFDPGFKEAVIGQINDLRRLAAGWDGYTAAAIDHDIAEAAIALVRAMTPHLAPRPRIVPLASGGLQLEWNAPQRSLELEFEGPSCIHCLRWQPSAGIEDENIIDSNDLAAIEALVGWYARSDV